MDCSHVELLISQEVYFNMSAQHHLFFDLDRTLWDFEKNSQHALKILFSEFQLDQKIKNFYDFLLPINILIMICGCYMVKRKLQKKN